MDHLPVVNASGREYDLYCIRFILDMIFIREFLRCFQLLDPVCVYVGTMTPRL